MPRAISRLSRNPLVVINPTFTPFLSVSELIITVVPCARKSIAEGSTFPFSRTLRTPVSKSGGVVSDFAVIIECWPVSYTHLTLPTKA